MTAAKKKGTAFELQVARRLEDAGLTVSRVGYQAGMHGDAHDLVTVVAGRGLRLECKRRKDGWTEQYRWLQQADALVMRADRKPALVCLPFETFLALVGDQQSETQEEAAP